MAEYAEKQEKLFGQQPLLLNDITKDGLKDPTISTAIKEATRALVSIAIVRMLQVKKSISTGSGARTSQEIN